MARQTNPKWKWYRFKMLGGSFEWVRGDTVDNMIAIHGFLDLNTDLGKKKSPRFSYLQISRETGIGRQQVATACKIMSYSDPPLLRITAVKYPKDGSARVAQKVKVVMPLKAWLERVGM